MPGGPPCTCQIAQMLTHPTVEKLQQLRCPGMAKALTEQLDAPKVDALSFEERLGLLVDRELTERHSRQLTNRLRRAKLRHDARIEDMDLPAARRSFTSQLPVDKWHNVVGDPTLADAILGLRRNG